ncbi:hypothetical protein [Jeotgalibaca caeni]|uniref:hypothetical protein n=1 Tax=Jeotgalibaca caeni TaxID=3028623 RepID=UPI00237E4019|nr:hypothetical protein [Jeotgalibaca caeni]MDE1548817.1 hypothetical protein [Jeotgalibaca caeni]
MSTKKTFIEDKLFYRFFNATYRYLKLNLYHTLFTVFFFISCNFLVVKGDTLFLFVLTAIPLGPSFMSMMESVERYKREQELPNLRQYAKQMVHYFSSGVVFSILLAMNLLWFFMTLLFLQQTNLGVVLLPVFFTFGSITLATIITAMVLKVNQPTLHFVPALKEAFFLNLKQVLVSYFYSVLIIGLLFVMYYRPVLGFLVLTSVVVTYLYNISTQIIIKNVNGGE